jgi:hypothetical protein
MRWCATWMGVLVVVLWAGASVLAQGQGKMEGKERGKDRAPQASKAQDNSQATNQVGEKNVGKGKAGKVEDSGTRPGGPTQGEPQGKKGGRAATDASDKGKGKGQEQRGQALQKQVQNDQAKHLERQARLARIRELAVKKGDTEMIARVDKLIAKEQDVYGRKRARLQGQPRAAPTAGSDKAVKTTSGPSDPGKGKGKTGAMEPKSDKEAKERVREQKKTDAKPVEEKK